MDKGRREPIIGKAPDPQLQSGLAMSPSGIPMKSLLQRIKSIAPENGYRISGTAYLAYGHRELGGSGSARRINISVSAEDALTLAKAESELLAAKMMANAYNQFPIDYAEPSWGVCNLEQWDLTITPIL